MIAQSIESNSCDTIVIGAGPFGLAVAAHLKARGVATRVFGDPMSFWRQNMPKGMKLRSPWGATTIADPAGALSLDVYIEAHGLARVEPLPIETFLGYGALVSSLRPRPTMRQAKDRASRKRLATDIPASSPPTGKPSRPGAPSSPWALRTSKSARKPSAARRRNWSPIRPTMTIWPPFAAGASRWSDEGAETLAKPRRFWRRPAQRPS